MSQWSGHCEAGSAVTGSCKTLQWFLPVLPPETSPTEASPAFRVQERSFFVRMKSTLTKRGLNVKASGYKVGMDTRSRSPLPSVSVLCPRLQRDKDRNWETLKASGGQRDLWVSGRTGWVGLWLGCGPPASVAPPGTSPATISLQVLPHHFQLPDTSSPTSFLPTTTIFHRSFT